MKDTDLLKKMRAAQFTENNGLVLRTINILRHRYERLKDIRVALEDMDESRFLDSIHFLSEAGYIKLRNSSNRSDAELSDANYTDLEAKVTEKGIRLLGGEITDRLVEA